MATRGSVQQFGQLIPNAGACGRQTCGAIDMSECPKGPKNPHMRSFSEEVIFAASHCACQLWPPSPGLRRLRSTVPINWLARRALAPQSHCLRLPLCCPGPTLSLGPAGTVMEGPEKEDQDSCFLCPERVGQSLASLLQLSSKLAKWTCFSSAGRSLQQAISNSRPTLAIKLWPAPAFATNNSFPLSYFAHCFQEASLLPLSCQPLFGSSQLRHDVLRHPLRI